MTPAEKLWKDMLALRDRCQNARWRTKPQAPLAHKTLWCWCESYNTTKLHFVEIPYPNGGDCPKYIQASSIDRLARVYADVQALNEWIDRVEAGEKRHAEEMRRQSAAKVVALETAATFQQ